SEPESAWAAANAGTVTPAAPNARPNPATQTSSAGIPVARSGPSPLVRARPGCGRCARITLPSATVRVPTRVTTAEPSSAAAASANSTKTATSSGPTTNTISNSEVSAANAVLRNAYRPVSGPVSPFQAPRIA